MISTDRFSREDYQFLLKWFEQNLLHLLPAETQLRGLSPEERLAGLNVEGRREVLRLLLGEKR